MVVFTKVFFSLTLTYLASALAHLLKLLVCIDSGKVFTGHCISLGDWFELCSTLFKNCLLTCDVDVYFF